MNTSKKKYIIYEFSISNIDNILEILNEKGNEGYRVISTHYYSKTQFGETVRYLLELEY